MRSYLLVASALLSGTVFADQLITLPDGKQVNLKDDFTWEYVTTKVESEVTTSGTPAKPSIAAIPVATAVTGTTIKLSDTKPSLQLSKSGVDILLGTASYQDGELVIPTAITNQSTQPIIFVSLKVKVFSTEGELLAEQQVDTWKSIKRMAETYLRPQSSAEGKSIKLVVDKQDQYQLQAEVIEVLAR
ncbi:DUF3157 family protein [Vibrio fortis]|uniref:DUF3157 family protein n=1 Tax=Vibrio fortis TaxID=212667 RepID=UPI0038CD3AEA